MRRACAASLSLAVLAALCVPAAEGADLVVLKNGQPISGTIDPSIDVGPDQVAINTGNGILRVPKSAIANEDLGFDARKKRLKPDDFAGHLALAAWCRSQGMNQEALAPIGRAHV